MNNVSWIAKHLHWSCIAYITSCCGFLCPFFHVQLQVTFVFLSATFKCSAHVLCLIFVYYLPSLSLSSPPSLTSNYPVCVKGKTFPSSLPVQLTSASFRGLWLNVLSCLSLCSTLPVLPVLNTSNLVKQRQTRRADDKLLVEMWNHKWTTTEIKPTCIFTPEKSTWSYTVTSLFYESWHVKFINFYKHKL